MRASTTTPACHAHTHKHVNLPPSLLLLPTPPHQHYQVSRGETKVHVQPRAETHSEPPPGTDSQTHTSVVKQVVRELKSPAGESRVCGGGRSFSSPCATLQDVNRVWLLCADGSDRHLRTNHPSVIYAYSLNVRQPVKEAVSLLLVLPFTRRPSPPTATCPICGLGAAHRWLLAK